MSYWSQMFDRQKPAIIAGFALLTSLWGALSPHGVMASVPVAGPPGPTYFLISLDRAPLGEAAEAVLIQSLRSTVVVDPGLEAEITFSVAEPMTTTELAEQFSVALGEEGVALVRSGDGFRLMDLQSALAERPRLDIVSVPPPELLPGAREGVSPFAPTAPIAVPEPIDNRARRWPVLVAILVVIASGPAWLFWRHGRLTFLRVRRVRLDYQQKQTRHGDVVIDRLLASETIDLALLAGACDIASRRSWPIEQVLCDLGGVSDEALADAYASVAGLERWRPSDRPPINAGLEPEGLAAALRDRSMSLIEADEWGVVVATSDPLDDTAFTEVSRLSGRMVTLVVAARSALTAEPFRDNGSAEPLPERLIIPWARKRDMDGATLLQAILNRRVQSSQEL